MREPIQVMCSGEVGCTRGYCAWPTVVRPAGEELLAVCSGGRERHICPFGRIHLYRSPDGGRHWTGPEILTDGPLDDRDAGIMRTPAGTLLVNWFTNILALTGREIPGHWREAARNISLETLCEEHGFWMKRSLDDGRTWSEKYRLPVNSSHGGAVLNDGSLLMVGRECSQSVGYLYEGSRLGENVVAARSCDDGLTWEVVSVLPMAPGHPSDRCFEPCVAQMPDGRIIAEIRDQSRFPRVETWQTESIDHARTWSTPHAVGNGCSPHLLKFDGDRLLLTYGWRSPPYGVHARISEDSGTSWSEEIPLYAEGRNADLGYPTTVRMEDGAFFTLWYESVNDVGKLKFIRWTIT